MWTAELSIKPPSEALRPEPPRLRPIPITAEDFPAALRAAGDLDRIRIGTTTMRSLSDQRARLARMESACAETERSLAIIENQIAARAERMTISGRVKARQFERGATTWTRADERDLQANIAALRFARRGEIDALTRKLARQTGAIAAFRIRYRFSEHEWEAAS